VRAGRSAAEGARSNPLGAGRLDRPAAVTAPAVTAYLKGLRPPSSAVSLARTERVRNLVQDGVPNAPLSVKPSQGFGQRDLLGSVLATPEPEPSPVPGKRPPASAQLVFTDQLLSQPLCSGKFHVRS